MTERGRDSAARTPRSTAKPRKAGAPQAIARRKRPIAPASCRIVAEGAQHRVDAGQRASEGQRQQPGEGEPGAGDPAGRGAIAGAERLRGERRHGGEDALQHDAAAEIEHPAETGGRERKGAEPPNHHRIGDAHRDLGEIGRGERRSQRQGRVQLGADGGQNGAASPPLGAIDARHPGSLSWRAAAGCLPVGGSPPNSNRGRHLPAGRRP